MEIRALTVDRLTWGESVRWDDRRQRLYAVDCATQTLHWLDGIDDPAAGTPTLETMQLPTMPTGVALTEDDRRLVVALDDGLHVVDPDARTTELLAAYPPELGARANDANADGAGGLVTGTLNLGPGPGSLWRYATADGWQHLDDGTGNTNGPTVVGGRLVVADTVVDRLFAYDYPAAAGADDGRRTTLLDTSTVGGGPDGACADADGNLWWCILNAGAIVRLDPDTGAVVRTVATEVEQPSDVTFGGAALDRMFVVSITIPLRPGRSVQDPRAGAILVIDGLGTTGRPEPRFRL